MSEDQLRTDFQKRMATDAPKNSIYEKPNHQLVSGKILHGVITKSKLKPQKARAYHSPMQHNPDIRLCKSLDDSHLFGPVAI